MHSGGKPFACDQFEYSTKRRHHLKTRKLTHSGKKPFACDQCEYSSTQAQALKRHILTHSGDRLYACNQCNHSSTTAPTSASKSAPNYRQQYFFSESTLATVTASTSFELASSHARVTSIKFTIQDIVNGFVRALLIRVDKGRTRVR